MNQKLIDEAILDMLKNLFILQPESSVILEMCASVLDFKLAKNQESMLIQFWVFTIRAVSSNNTALGCLKTLFQKYSNVIDFNKDYNGVEFLKII